jgi:hypothetical protein
MNSKQKASSIPIEGSIGCEDWLKGRRCRRALGNRVAPKIIGRKTSSSDRRLKKLFNGGRGLPLKQIQEPSTAPALLAQSKTPPETPVAFVC